jgi:hypothetical protein
MSISLTRGVVWALVVAVPTSLLGQTPTAILHTQGGVWVNGYEAKDSSAIFTGDLVETKPEFSASLSLEGSTVLIQPESVAKLQENMLVLDYGSVSVGTSKSFKVQVKCITVAPVSSDWTQYDVTDVNGTIRVAARKSDVYVQRETSLRKPSPETGASHEGLVREGEQRSYEESQVCGTPARPAGAGPVLNSKWIVAGAGIGIVVLICVIACGGGGPPISPKSP